MTNIDYGNVLIAGCGGTGIEIIKILLTKNFKSLTFLDKDTIEITNLNRQFFYRKADIGRYKSEVLYERIKEILKIKLQKQYIKDTKIEKIYDKIDIYFRICRVEEIDVLPLINENGPIIYDYVFCCLDNVSSRMALNLYEYRCLIDCGVEGNMCHVKKVIKGETSCLYCIKEIYSLENYIEPCGIRNSEKNIERENIIKKLLKENENNIPLVVENINTILWDKGFDLSNIDELENFKKNYITSTCYINSICASLAFILLKDLNNCFMLYNGLNFQKFKIKRSLDCLVCSNK